MYSKNFYWLIEKAALCASTLGSSCIYFDGKLKIFYITTTARRRFYIVTGMIVILWAFVAGRTLQLHLNGDKRHFAISYALSLAFSIITIPVVIYCRDPNELRFMMGEATTFAQNFQKKWIPHFDFKTSPTGRNYDIFLALTYFCLHCLGPFVILITSIVLRDFPVLPHTMLPKSFQNFWIFIPEYTLIFHISNIYCYTASFHITTLSVYFVTLIPLIKGEFTANRKETKYRTHHSLRSVDNIITEYVIIEYFHKRGMKFYGQALIPIHALIGQFILYCNFTLIRHRKKLDIIIEVFLAGSALAAFIFWVFLLEAAGRFQKDSAKCLASWKYIKSPNPIKLKLFRKYRKRFRPLVISAGEYFKIKRLHVLKFMRSIVSGTFRALLTIKR